MLTIDDNGVRVFLGSACMAQRAADAVRAVHDRRKPYAKDREALWDAWWLAKHEAETCVAELTKRGGLLHFGSAAALERMRTTESAHA